MRILIIEDDKEIGKFLRAGLRAECYAVDNAEDGRNGSYMARTNHYDLVILDLNLPEKDGEEVCQEIRLSRDVPIIALTVRSEIDEKVRLFESGVDDYLLKPFSFQELLARIRAVTRRPKIRKGQVLEMGGIILDADKHLVRKDGKVVGLTRKEFSLLEYLMLNKGSTVSRSMIMEHVWDINADPFSNTVESHVFNLRKKLGGASRNKIIKTVSGVGYRIG